MGKRKILILIPSLTGGGAERSLINLLQRVDYSKYMIDLAVVSFNGVYINYVPDQVKLIKLFRNDLLVRILAYLQKKYGMSYIFKKVIRFKIKTEYDVGISFLDGNFTDLLFFVHNLSKKVTWVHSSYKSYSNFAKFYENETYRNKIRRERYGKLNAIIFVSKDAKIEFEEIFGIYPYMKVVYNLIDKSSILIKADEVVFSQNERFSFIALGSLLPVKGYDRLIRAAKIVKDNGFDFNIGIIGEGPERSNLKKLIAKLGLKLDVYLIGFQSNPYPFLKKSNAFVMSSVSEALPTVLCEAMILGKPVLVTNCAGCRELVENGVYGLMAEQDDISLAEKMIQFIENPEILKSYAQKSSERSLIFDDEKMLADYYKVFDL